MRTSLGDHLVALRRPAALAALAAAAGGGVAVVAPRLALWRLTARVQALDTVGRQDVTALDGATTSSLTWVIAAVGVAVIGLAVLVAVDRPPPHAEAGLVGAGLFVAVTAIAMRAMPPATSAFTGDVTAADLVSGSVPLPTGVGIDLWVEPAAGLWLLVGAGALIVAGTLVALRRG